jgi:hypothetical protein
VSDTPKTDKEAYDVIYRGDMGCTITATDREQCDGGSHVDSDFARSLERENAAMRAGLAEAYKIIDVLYMDALDNHKESWPRARKWMEQWKEVAK